MATPLDYKNALSPSNQMVVEYTSHQTFKQQSLGSLLGASGFSGMDWNGGMEWNGGMVIG